ncbi:MAG: Fe2+-dependent dioxygenase [Alphaproteobacteria bacterium]
MLLQIPQIFNPSLLNELKVAMAKVDFKPVLNDNSQIQHYQLPLNSIESKYFGQQVLQALQANALFISSAIPNRIFPPIFKKFQEGQGHATKIESALKHDLENGVRIRQDLSATIFLSDLNEYQDGELVIEDNYGTHKIKLPAGDMIMYPSSSLHFLKPITQGSRITINIAIESMIRQDNQRTILFDMDTTIRSLVRENPEHEAVPQLSGIYHNLLRMWID